MKCNICGKEIIGYGNNPYPLSQRDDIESRCCDDCNTNCVITARLVSMCGELNKYEDANYVEERFYLESGDTLAIFYSINSDIPLKHILETGTVLIGQIDNIDREYNQVFGNWGRFGVDMTKDTFMKIEEI